MADKETKDGTLLDPLALGDLFGIQREPDEVHYNSPLSVLRASFEVGGVAELSGLAGGSSAASKVITQANTFSAGDLVCRLVGSWVLADANNSRPCHALVISAVGGQFTAAVSGFQVWTAHGKTVGAYYYLSTTAGAIVTPKPTALGQIIQRVLVPIDTNTIILTIGEAWT